MTNRDTYTTEERELAELLDWLQWEADCTLKMIDELKQTVNHVKLMEEITHGTTR